MRPHSPHVAVVAAVVATAAVAVGAFVAADAVAVVVGKEGDTGCGWGRGGGEVGVDVGSYDRLENVVAAVVDAVVVSRRWGEVWVALRCGLSSRGGGSGRIC